MNPAIMYGQITAQVQPGSSSIRLYTVIVESLVCNARTRLTRPTNGAYIKQEGNAGSRNVKQVVFFLTSSKLGVVISDQNM